MWSRRAAQLKAVKLPLKCNVRREMKDDTMTQLESFLRGNEQQKVSSAGFIVGAVLIIIGNFWVTLVGLGNPLEALGEFS